MKSFIQKILILAALVSATPFISHAATVTCTPSYANDLVGKTVNVTATVNDGAGTSYDFSWGGDDGFDDNRPVASHIYSQEGSMTITVNASSTDSTDNLSGTCSVDIYTDATLPAFSATCEPSTDRGVIGQTITWNPTISGPLEPYTTIWTGTDGLEGNSKVYDSSGDKTATMVSFLSRYGAETSVHNAKLANVSCNYPVYIVPEEIHNPTALTVTGSCSASPQTIFTGGSLTWNSDIIISGGAAPYRITWTDSEGTVGTGSSTSKVYSVAGSVIAYLTVDDNAGQSSDINCSNSVAVRNYTIGGGSSSKTCSFTYSDWGSCVAGSQERTATGDYTDCSNSPEEILSRACIIEGSNSTSTSTTTPDTSGNASSTDKIFTSTSTPEVTNNEGDITEDTNGYDVKDDYVFTEDKNPGTYSEDVANLQRRLTEEGVYKGLVGGFFGPATEQALRDYQKNNGLTETGVLDIETRNKLNNLVDSIATSTEQGINSPSLFSGLTAAVINFGGNNWPIVIYIVLIVLAISLIYWLFILIKKSDKNIK